MLVVACFVGALGMGVDIGLRIKCFAVVLDDQDFSQSFWMVLIE